MNDNNTMTPGELLDYLVDLLQFAGKHEPLKIAVSGFRPFVQYTQRAKDPHEVDAKGKPIRGPGTVTITLPDEAVLDLGHQTTGNDAWFLCRVRRSVLDKMKERKESVLVLPGYLQ